ncbi:MAG: exodeoxyribonuclease III [Patescibacteria group bacterium]
MKIYSWNINGLRAVLKKPEFFDFLKNENPDILLLQEIKISKEARKKTEIDFEKFGYATCWNSASRPGYSGTLILIKNHLDVGCPSGCLSECSGSNPSLKSGLGIEKFDAEGRVQTLEFPDFFLINAYFPNSNHELSRLDYKMDFNNELHKYIKKLEKQKPVIIGGDFNVAHQEIDLARPKDNLGNAGFTNEERGWMTKFLASGFVDTYRVFYPNKIKYSWWSYRFFCRDKGIGWRIDYFCVSKGLVAKIKSAQIHSDIFGSDHCPISIDLKL